MDLSETMAWSAPTAVVAHSSGILGHCHIAPKFAISHLGYIVPMLYSMLYREEQMLYSRCCISFVMWYITLVGVIWQTCYIKLVLYNTPDI